MDAQLVEQSKQRPHVTNVGHMVQRDGPFSEQASRHDGQRRVFRTRNRNLALQATAPDDA